MSVRRKSPKSGASGELPQPARGRNSGAAGKDRELVQEFVWNIISVNTHIEDIRYIWAKLLGISGPQWLILTAINHLDQGAGVSVRDVSAKLHVDPSFVTTQTKSLEKQGFLQRITSASDARVVLMSLTDKAYKGIANLSSRHELLNEFIYSDLDERTLRDLVDKLITLRKRLEKAPLKLASEL